MRVAGSIFRFDRDQRAHLRLEDEFTIAIDLVHIPAECQRIGFPVWISVHPDCGLLIEPRKVDVFLSDEEREIIEWIDQLN